MPLQRLEPDDSRAATRDRTAAAASRTSPARPERPSAAPARVRSEGRAAGGERRRAGLGSRPSTAPERHAEQPPHAPEPGLEHVLTALTALPSVRLQVAADGDLSDVVDATVDAVPGWASISAQIVVLVVAAVLLRWLVHRAINRIVRRAIAAPNVSEAVRQRLLDQSASLLAERRKQRTETVGSVLRSVSSIVIFAVTMATVLGEVGVELGPLLASAGIVGVALGFGAQNLVKDFLNGIFMILEDQYGVGDAIDAGEASGIVESVGLRVTRLRSVDGTVWHIRNGEIVRIGNMSQGWSRALLDVSVAYGTDVDQAQDVIKAVADGLWHDEEFGRLVLEEPEVWGVEMFGADGIAIRLVVKTAPLEQWKVARELRRRLKEAFDEHGIEIPFPQRALWLRTAPGEAPSPVFDSGESAPSAAGPPAETPPDPDVSPSKRRTAAGGEADVARADTGAMRRPSTVRQVGEVEGPYDDEQRPATP